MNKAPHPYFSNTFAKGLRVLDLFSSDRSSLNLKEIAEGIGTNTSSAFRFTNTLVELNYLKKDPRTKLMTLGPKTYFLGLKLVKSFSLLQIVKPFINDVFNAQKITIDSAVLEENALLQLYYCPAKDTLTYQFPIVNTAIHCTALGKAIMAFLPESELLAILDRVPLIKRTENSITDRAVLLAELEKTRKRGYSITNEEYIAGMFAIGAPFLNLETGRPAGAVSFDFSVIQSSIEAAEKEYADILLKLGKDISKAI